MVMQKVLGSVKSEPEVIGEAIDFMLELVPVVGGPLAFCGKLIRKIYGYTKAEIISDGPIVNESTEILDMTQRVESLFDEGIRIIYLQFSRPFDKNEQDEFTNLDKFTEAYSGCKITMESLEISDDNKSLTVFFDEDLKEFDVVRFSVFIDKYVQEISKELHVESVSVGFWFIILFKKDITKML